MAKDIFHEHVKEALVKDGWEIVYDVFFQHPFGENAIEEEHLKLLIFDPKEKKITKWIR